VLPESMHSVLLLCWSPHTSESARRLLEESRLKDISRSTTAFLQVGRARCLTGGGCYSLSLRCSSLPFSACVQAGLHAEESRASAAHVARGSAASGWGRLLHHHELPPLYAEAVPEESGNEDEKEGAEPEPPASAQAAHGATDSRGTYGIEANDAGGRQLHAYHSTQAAGGAAIKSTLQPGEPPTPASVLRRHFSAYEPGSPVSPPADGVDADAAAAIDTHAAFAAAVSASEVAAAAAAALDPLPYPELTHGPLSAMSLPRLEALRSGLIKQREAATLTLHRLVTARGQLTEARGRVALEVTRRHSTAASASGTGSQQDGFI
jgi:hypothetical protein